MGVVAAAVLRTVRLDRFLEWDEAVFFSQSGGLNGSGAEPVGLVASREIGTPRLIGFLRALSGGDVADTRLLWVLVGLAVLGTGCWTIGRVCGVRGWLVFGLFGTFWVTQLFLGGFFSFALAAGLTLCVLAAYLHLRADRDAQLASGAWLGIAVAALLWVRQVDGALVVAGLTVHSAAVTPRAFWASRWRGVGVAVAAATVTFAVPWMVDSANRYGSVLGRIDAGRAQEYERGLTNNVGEYLGVLRGRSFYWAQLGTPPRWSLVALDLLLVLLVIAVIVGALIASRPRRSGPRADAGGPRVGAVILCMGTSVLLLAFFVLFIGAVSDRYLLMGLAPATVIVALTIDRAAHHWWGPVRATLAVGLLVLVWAGVNTVVAQTYEARRAAGGDNVERTTETIRALAEEGPCSGFARYGAPVIQVATGCAVTAGSSLDAALAEVTARAQSQPERLVFLLWPTAQVSDADVPEGWSRLERPSPFGSDKALLYRPLP